jgi:quinoprotein glucose dehydrogenase
MRRSLLIGCGVVIGMGGGRAAESRALQATPTSQSVWSGVFTAAQAERGAALYANECANCHASNLSGNESVPSLTGDEFLGEYDGKAVRDLFDVIAKTMPEDSPGRLSRQQDADVLAFIMSANRFPAGDTELPSEDAALNQIRWQKTR